MKFNISIQHSLQENKLYEVIKFGYSIIKAFLKINDLQLKLNYINIENKTIEMDALIQRIATNYLQEILLQFYKLVLGLDVIGSPINLVTNLAGGFKDLFYEPFQGMQIGPAEFFKGIGIGTKTFTSSVFGNFLLSQKSQEICLTFLQK